MGAGWCRHLAVGVLLAGALCFQRAAVAQLDQPDATKAYSHIWESVEDELWEAVADLRAAAPSWNPERASSKVLLANLEVVNRLIDATRLEASAPESIGESVWAPRGENAREYRRSAYLLSVDATRLMAEGDADGAAKRVAAILRLMKQLASVPRMESAALAVMCLELVDEQITALTEAASLTDLGRQELRVALTALDPVDPAGCKRGLEEALAGNEWIRERFKGDDAGEQIVQSLPISEERKRADAAEEPARFEDGRRGREGGRMRGGGRRGFWISARLIAELRALDEEGVGEATRSFERMYRHAMEAWEQPDAVERLQRIDFDAARQIYGPLGPLRGPGFARQRRTAERVEGAVERIRLAVIAR